MKDKLKTFFNKKVELRAHGVFYRGLLVGADEEFIYLKSEVMYMTLPLDNVTAIRYRDEDSPDGEWEVRAVEGEPKPDPEAREAKKRYRTSDFDMIHQSAGDWPDQNARPGSDPEDGEP